MEKVAFDFLWEKGKHVCSDLNIMVDNHGACELVIIHSLQSVDLCLMGDEIDVFIDDKS